MSSETKKAQEAERRLAVLSAICGICGLGEAIGFKPIMRETGLDRAQVRAACRQLADLGQLLFVRALMSDDGEFRGSGYGPTVPGLTAYYAGQLDRIPQPSKET